MSNLPHLAVAAVAALAVALAARRARALSASGAAAAALVGFLLFGLGGGRAALALLLFFVSSSALSRWRRREKERFDWEKGGERDAGQVLANGGVAALAALLLFFFPRALWPEAALLGALAAANADTWATEIGALSRVPPRLITTLRPAPLGASGAVSLRGTMAALAGALVVAAVALWWRTGFAGFLAAGAGGFIGALVDSLLGATLQAQFRCPVCGRLTERRAHCAGGSGELARGLAFLGNDAVNFLATLAGAAASAALLRSLG
jgi:uncharacterized protein (TIGR00297 family)